jgi:hypothetical protein
MPIMARMERKMIELKVNNNRTIQIHQVSKVDGNQNREITVDTFESDGQLENYYGIPEGDFIMLLNYYRYIKDNNIQCDFINYNGKNSK